MKISKILKDIFSSAGAAIGIIVGIIICLLIGRLLRWMLWLVCFVVDIFIDSKILDWIGNHDTFTLIICTLLSPLFLIDMFRDRDSNQKPENMNDGKQSGNFSYEKETREMNRNSFCFVDCSGAYRHWGDSFIDHKGNWCSWGSGFYDYDDNYIHWGGTYKDSSGSYRHFGDGFVDCAGNYIHIP